jgi:hypothetical protein
MSTFAAVPALSSITPLDPAKRVKFTRGMVLGPEDFIQEHEYLARRDQWIVRDLIGYGAVSGLRLSVGAPPAGEEAKGPRVGVSPGVGVLPSGRMVCVTPAQCAFLGEWIASKRAEIEAEPGSPPAVVPAYVVLSYAETETDDVPIPGEPCRSEDNLMAPSRIKDGFGLELRLEPPEQREEDAVRWLAAWLAAVPIEAPGSDLVTFLDALRADADEDASPPTPDASPPAGLAIPPERVAEYLDAAFALWTAELRGPLRTQVPGCECGPGIGCPPEDDVLLLGRLDIPVVWDSISGDAVLGDDVEIDLSERPTLVHLRLLQEWLLMRRGGAEREPVARATVRGAEIQAEGMQVFAVNERDFHLVPDAFDPGAAYAISGAGLRTFADGPPVLVQQIDPDDPALLTALAGAGIIAPGLTVRAQVGSTAAAAIGFSVRVEKIGGAP